MQPVACHIMTFYWTVLLTYLWSLALPEKLQIVQPFKNFPAFYGTRRFIATFTRAFHWSLSWARSIQSPYHPVLSLQNLFSYYPPTYVLVFLVVSFLLAFPPIPVFCEINECCYVSINFVPWCNCCVDGPIKRYYKTRGVPTSSVHKTVAS
jgi:hypothetical protein